ncbi:MAG: hypothetical protein JNM31_11755 [Flavobacteriales bacterium]|nr:hypothetical protein [Flavobacteriales bacterium]
MERPLILFLPLLLAFSGGDKPPVSWSISTEEVGQERVKLTIAASVKKGWHIYAMEQERDDGPLPTEFSFAPSAAFGLVGDVREPAPASHFDANFGMTVRSHEGYVTYEALLQRRTSDAFSVELHVEYMACDDRMCLPPLKVPLRVNIPALSASPK